MLKKDRKAINIFQVFLVFLLVLPFSPALDIPLFKNEQNAAWPSALLKQNRRKKLIKDKILNNVRIGKYSGIGEITAVGIFLVLAQLFLGQISKLLTFLEGDNNCISPSVASDNLGGLEVLVKDGAGGLAFFL